MRKRFVWLLVIMLLIPTLFSSAFAEEQDNQNLIPAFPGAEGGGKYTSGGRGGNVYFVTNLNDSGPGSLREGVKLDNTTIIFRVGGTIDLKSRLDITGTNLTIAGQTAPGNGISIIGHDVSLGSDNVIIRYLRFRLGDKNEIEADAFGSRYHKNIMIDHSSFSWSVDEVLSLYANLNTTVQWSIISESMLMTAHQKGRHGYGGIQGGYNASFHHNLFAHNFSRNPRFPGVEPALPDGLVDHVDFQNNVIYNWGLMSSYGGENGQNNIANNYYKPGVNTYQNSKDMIHAGMDPRSNWYVNGNVMYGSEEVTADNWKGVQSYTDVNVSKTLKEMDHPLPDKSAENAFQDVLNSSGAILPKRDSIDARIVHEVKEGTGHIISSQKEVGGYPTFELVESDIVDNDGDGMPDDWEVDQGLNPKEPDDRNGDQDSDGYTNLEEYLNTIISNGSVNPEVDIVSPKMNSINKTDSSLVIEASAKDSDGKVAKVEFYKDGVKLGEDDSAPYKVTWDHISEGTHYLTAKAIDDTGTSTDSSNVVIHANTAGDISPWDSTDIGNPEIPGHTQVEKGSITVKSSGDVEGASDHFHYAHQELAGNGEIIAKVEQITATDDGAEAGVMIRESLTDSSPMVMTSLAYVKGGKQGQMLTRLSPEEKISTFSYDSFIQTPYWVRLVRIGNQFTSLISENGKSWEKVGTKEFPMAEKVYIGLMADSAEPDDNFNKYNTSRFSNVAINPLPEGYPTSPVEVTANAGEKQVTVSWEKVEGATSYQVKQSEMQGGPYTNVLEVTDTSSVIEGLTPGKKYYFVVSAINMHGESINSSEASAIPTGTPETIVYINDDFETEELDAAPEGYELEPIPQTEINRVFVSEVPSDSEGNSSAKAIKLHDEGGTNVKFTKKFTPQKDTVVVEFDFMQPRMAGTSKILQLQNESGTKTAISIEMRKPDGEDAYTLVLNNNGYIKLAPTPVDNKWYHIMAVANVANSTVDIFINGKLVAEGIGFNSDVKDEGIGRIHSVTPGSGSGSYFIDNLKVYHEPIASPKNVSVLEGEGEVTLKWQASKDAESYTIKRSETTGGPYKTLAEGVKETTYNDKDVQNNVTYYYVVTSKGLKGESDPSTEVIATPSGAPENMVLVEDDFENGEVGGAPQDYTVGPVPQTDINKTIITRIPDNSTGNTSTQVLKLHDEGGTNVTFSKSFTPQKSTVVVEADFMQPAMAGTARFLKLENEEGNKTAVSLELRKPPGEDAYTIVYSKSGAFIKLIDTPENNKWYHLKIVANSVTSKADIYINDDLVGEGLDFTDTLASEGIGRISSATPGSGGGHIYFDNIKVYVEPLKAPVGLRATAGNTKVQLDWDVSEGALSYNVKRSTVSGGPYTAVAKGVSENTFIDSNLDNGKTYYYVVSGNGELGESKYSKEITVTPTENPDVPEVPKDLRVNSRSTQVDISWSEVPNATSYVIKRSTKDGGPYDIVADDFKGTSFRDGGLKNGTEYYYVISAKHIGGESKYSQQMVVTPIAALATPEELKAEAGDEQIIISWNPVLGADKYDIKRANHSDGPFETIKSGVTAESFTDKGLTNGMPYYYVVTAVNGQTVSLDSKAVGTRAIENNGKPHAPTDLKLSYTGNGELRIQWDSVEGADSYNVKRREGSNQSFVTVAEGLKDAEVTDKGLSPGQDYYYVVTAVNEKEEGFSSEQLKATAALVITVAKDGTGDFDNVQSAINSIPDNNKIRTVINIKSGVYREKLVISSSKTMLSLIGQGERPEDTLLINNDNAKTIGPDGKELGTSNSYSVLAQANDFVAENLTIENDSGNDTSQAVALSARGDRQVYRNVRILGWQDTLYSNDNVRQYYVDSYIAGDVDFIFGSATAVFENSIIHHRDSGYVTAASTEKGRFGYVFINSKLTAEENLTSQVDLGRPWRPYSNVIFINTWMDDHVRPTGWNNWGNPNNELTANYAEYGSSGPGGDPEGRYSWVKQLTVEEAAQLTARNILSGKDGWDPVETETILSSNAYLKGISIEGTALTDFSKDQFEYDVNLAVSTDELPSVSAESEVSSSLVLITQTEKLPGQTTIEVTSEDGTKNTYKINFVNKLEAPTNVSVTDEGTFIHIKWSAVENADSYVLKRSSVKGGEYETIATVNGEEFKDYKLNYNQAYYYIVIAKNENGEGKPSLEVEAKLVDRTSPVWPNSTLNVPHIGAKTVKLTWSPAEDRSGVTAYKIFQNGIEIKTLSADVNEFVVEGLAKKTKYTFKVESLDRAGNISTDGPERTVTTVPNDNGKGFENGNGKGKGFGNVN